MSDNSNIRDNSPKSIVKSRIKILELISYFSTNINDPGDFTSDFVQGLKKNNYEILVVVPHLYGATFHEFIKEIEVIRFPYFFPLRYQKLAYGSGIPYNIQESILAKIQIVPFVISELITTVLIVRKHHVNLINSHWFVPQGFIGAICKKVFNLPHIATIHSSEITLMKKVPLGSYIADFIISNSDIIISVSKHRADELIRFASPENAESIKEKLKIIPMGTEKPRRIDHNNIANMKEKMGLQGKKILLFIGRLVEVKGCEYAILSMEKLVNRYPDLILLIIGSGPLSELLSQQVNGLGLEKNIRFLGYIDHSHINEYYTISDIIIFPSIVDSAGFEEGLPVVLVEAIAAGKPIVATKTKGVFEIINDGWNGILVEPKNPEQIAIAISSLLNDSEYTAFISSNALTTAKDYDWQVISERYSNIIHELCYPRDTVEK